MGLTLSGHKCRVMQLGLPQHGQRYYIKKILYKDTIYNSRMIHIGDPTASFHLPLRHRAVQYGWQVGASGAHVADPHDVLPTQAVREIREAAVNALLDTEPGVQIHLYVRSITC